MSNHFNSFDLYISQIFLISFKFIQNTRKRKTFLFNSADMRSKISVVTHVVEHNIKNGHLEKNELDKKGAIFRIYI